MNGSFRKYFENKILNPVLHFLNTRIFFVGSILLVQLILIILLVFLFSQDSKWIRFVLIVLNVLLVIKVINRTSNTSYKLAWILIILGLPLSGGLIYLLFAERKVPKKLRGKIIHELANARGFFDVNKTAIEDDNVKQIFSYVQNNSYYPYYHKTRVEYFSAGEDYFAAVLQYLKKAKHFVFIEYFIVKEGYMFEELLKVLSALVKKGVKVYFLYDDGGSISCLPENFEERLKNAGIEVVAFSPVSLSLSLLSRTNNRSHRKMIVIDNRYAFTGGYNLADEYINKIVRFGHWKDTGILLEGEAVWNFTVMFIQFYNASVIKEKNLAYLDFKYQDYVLPDSQSAILPFSDSPTDDEDIARSTHLMLISHARKYVYIHTPYLVLDYDLVNALKMAAHSGVEVIITVPHIPDKKTVFMVTRANYIELLKAGVKIYEYTPGFIHSKLWVVDDKVALMSTFNMDYRSYYLNYECGVLIYDDQVIEDMKKDYLATLVKSEEITLAKAQKVRLPVLIIRSILNVFAPLL